MCLSVCVCSRAVARVRPGAVAWKRCWALLPRPPAPSTAPPTLQTPRSVLPVSSYVQPGFETQVLLVLAPIHPSAQYAFGGTVPAKTRRCELPELECYAMLYMQGNWPFYNIDISWG